MRGQLCSLNVFFGDLNHLANITNIDNISASNDYNQRGLFRWNLSECRMEKHFEYKPTKFEDVI